MENVKLVVGVEEVGDSDFPTSPPSENFEQVVSVIKSPPKVVFLIPYRNREEHLRVYMNQMNYILEDVPATEYEFYIVHQDDSRPFNRGAMKNIGFLYVKNKYPNDYLDITLVFNDVDTTPKDKNHIDYRTTRGVIKHYYGFTFALGGIVSITGADFEKTSGFPNFWAWGYEDNLLNTRAIQCGIHIDRSVFCDISVDKKQTGFVSLSSGLFRDVNKNEFVRYMGKTKEGIHHIQNIRLAVDASRVLPDEYTFPCHIEVLNISGFDTGVLPPSYNTTQYDLRKGATPFGKVMYRRNGRVPLVDMIL